MKKLPKSFWIIIIVVFLILIATQIIWPAKKESGDANLIVINNSQTPVGMVGVSYPRWDGSQVSEGASNADGSMLAQGDKLYFNGVQWPAVVTVYSDLQGEDSLMYFVVEEAPEENGRWQATIYDSDTGLSLTLESVPKVEP